MKAIETVCKSADWLAEHPESWATGAYGYYGPNCLENRPRMCVIGKCAESWEVTPSEFEEKFESELRRLDPTVYIADFTIANDESETVFEMRDKIHNLLGCS